MDPWYFGTQPDPRIRTTELRIRIRILLFSSVAFKMSKNISLFFLSFLLLFFVGTFPSLFKDKKSWRSHFYYCFCFMMEGCGSGSGQIMTDPQHCIRWSKYCDFLDVNEPARLGEDCGPFQISLQVSNRTIPNTIVSALTAGVPERRQYCPIPVIPHRIKFNILRELVITLSEW